MTFTTYKNSFVDLYLTGGDDVTSLQTETHDVDTEEEDYFHVLKMKIISRCYFNFRSKLYKVRYYHFLWFGDYI